MKKNIMQLSISFAFLLLLTVSCVTTTGNDVLFPNDQTYHHESLRALGYANTDGADVNEVLTALGNIEEGNRESWFENWFLLASRVEEQANRFSNETISRGKALLRASNYYRTAEFLLSHEDPRKLETYRNHLSSFYSGLDLLDVPYIQSEIVYESSSLDYLFFPNPIGNRRKTLILMINGYDSVKKETYFTLGQAALERGYSFLSYDGPGQGSSIREKNIPMTPEWGNVNTAVLDQLLETYPDLESIVVVGFSLGSVFATKAASDDPRIDLLVHYNIFHDFSLAVGNDMDDSFAAQVFSEDGVNEHTESMLAIGMSMSSEVDWALRHGAWIMGEESYAQALNNYRLFEISQDAPRVTIPVLLLAGENDHFVPIELLELSREAFSNSSELTSIVYGEESGGDEHCQVGAMQLWHGDLFQWIHSHLGALND
jgi:pimeloyl-ACP methyl ester carboxylesterase